MKWTGSWKQFHQKPEKQVEAIDNLRAGMTVLANEDYFIYGFRLGARLILDVVGDYKGQFYSPGEAG